ncbi:MAG: aminotransferase class I/II-fold pyridoxal phosphate-dependent enzyme [Thalassovita sp.]
MRVPRYNGGNGAFASDADFAPRLLDRAGVAVVPGRVFGMPGHIRLSFAYSETELEPAGPDR